MAIRFYLGFILFLSQALTPSLAAGILEVQLVSFSNDFSKDISGTCCRHSADLSASSLCQRSCSPFFRVCLKQWQNPVLPEAPCYFGSRLTQVFNDRESDSSSSIGRRFNFTQYQDYRESLKFPFSFNWPGTFSLIVEAWHGSTNGSIVHNTNGSGNGSSQSEKQLLIRVAELRELKVGAEWTLESHANDFTRLDLQYRVVCDEFYYGSDCSRSCRPRNDQYGHHVCTADGNKRCMEGWTGSLCNRAVCKPGCHPDNGYCTVPGECTCYLGHQGDSCDQCVRYPGCVHGSCKRAFECQCDEGWGGLFCNQDLNFCTHHKPCMNGATCTNTGSGHYTCQCRPGYTGANCEHRSETCEHEPCMNGGTCKQRQTNYTCSCPVGFSGRHCQSNARSCADKPCENGATCVDFSGGYQCVCSPGFEGTNCDVEQDECAEKTPCLNGGTCINRRISSSDPSSQQHYECSCPMGFSGVNCEVNINDCSIQPCLNGGTCVDQVGAFQCRCRPGFMGVLCQYNIDDCLKRPCANGGTCFDLVNDYRCMCRPGFRGKDCSIDVNECESNPCRNGGTCVDGVDAYMCRCPSCYAGVNCQQRNDECAASTDWSSSNFGFGMVYNVSSPFASVGYHSPSNQDESSDGRASGKSTMIAIGVPILIVFVLVLIALALVVLFLYRKTRQRRRASSSSNLASNLDRQPYQKSNELKSCLSHRDVSKLHQQTTTYNEKPRKNVDHHPHKSDEDYSPNFTHNRRLREENVNLAQPNYYKVITIEKLNFSKAKRKELSIEVEANNSEDEHGYAVAKPYVDSSTSAASNFESPDSGFATRSIVGAPGESPIEISMAEQSPSNSISPRPSRSHHEQQQRHCHPPAHAHRQQQLHSHSHRSQVPYSSAHHSSTHHHHHPPPTADGPCSQQHEESRRHSPVTRV